MISRTIQENVPEDLTSCRLITRHVAFIVTLALAMVSNIAWGNTRTHEWQQIADAPYALPDATLIRQGAQRLFQIERETWTDWHIPAPGKLALRIDENVNPNDVLDIYQSNGSGFLQQAKFRYDAHSGLWVMVDVAYGTKLIHSRAAASPVLLEAYFQQDGKLVTPSGQHLSSTDAQARQVRPHRLNAAYKFYELPASTARHFSVTGARTIRIRMRLPFARIPRSSQDFQLDIRVDGVPLSAPRLRAFQDRKQAWLVDGEAALLSRQEDFYLELPVDAKTLQISSTHLLLVQSHAVSAEEFLFPQWNKTANAQTADRGATALQQLLDEQIEWQALLRSSEDNLSKDAPLQTTASLSASAVANTQHAQFRSSIQSRYTDLMDLLPHAEPIFSNNYHDSDSDPEPPSRSRFEAQYAEYRGARLLDPAERNAQRWLGAAQLSSAANRAPSAWFIQLQPQESLDFVLPKSNFASALRVVAKHSNLDAAANIEIEWPSQRIDRLRLDPRRVFEGLHDPSYTGAWSKGVARMTAAEIGYAELSVPSNTPSLRLHNRGTTQISLALQQRVPKRYRHNERDWIHLLTAAEPSMADLWWQTWDGGLTDSQRWQAFDAVAALSTTSRHPANGLIPTLHYLGEQVSLFQGQGSLAVTNLHCNAEKQPSQESAKQVITLAEHWESSAQWTNASEAWKRALPNLEDQACVQAHRSIAANLLRTGSHQLAETYLQTIIKETQHEALRRASVDTLKIYYQEQQIQYAAIQLAAYVAMRWREPGYMLDLIHALFDGGQDRTGLDVALVTPAVYADSRVWATLVKTGWASVLDLLRRHQHGPSFEPDVFTRLWTLRQSTLQDLQFGGSVLLHDTLLDATEAHIIATPEQPVSFTVTGPLHLRVSLRPYVQGAQPTDPQGWASLKVGAKNFPVPISLHTSITRYKLSDDPGASEPQADDPQVVGAQTQQELDLGPGEHRVRIGADAWPMAVTLHKRTIWHTALNETLHMNDPRVSVLHEPPVVDHLPYAAIENTTSDSTVPNSIGDYTLQVALPPARHGYTKLLTLQPDNRAAIHQLMRALTYAATQAGEHGIAMAHRAEWLAYNHVQDRQIASLRNRLRRSTTWRTVELTQGHAGIYLQRVDGFDPESEFWRHRNLFLPDWQPGELLLTSGQRLDLAFNAPVKTALRLKLAHTTVTSAQNTPIDLRVEHNDNSDTLTLLPKDSAQTILLKLKSGEHSTAIVVDEFAHPSLVKVAVAQLIDGNWETISRSINRRFYVADAAQPVNVAVRGPAWLRIDQQTSKGVTSRYEYLATGETPAALTYANGSDALGRFRIFARQPASPSTETNRPTVTTPQATPWPAQLKLALTADTVHEPANQAGGTFAHYPFIIRHEDAATYSIANAWHANDEASEDARFPVGGFFETKLSRRHRDAARDDYDESNLHLRMRDSGASLGGSYFAWHDLEDTPFSIRAGGRLFVQNHDSGSEWSAQASFALRHGMRINTNRYHSSEIETFARYVSADTGGSDFDPDVFTPYRADHRNGIRMSHRLTWQHYQDAQIYGELSLRSNEWQQHSLDQLRTRWGARMQARRFQLGGEFQLTHYLADDDRQDALSIPRLKLSSRWYSKPRAHGRWELRGQLGYDFDIHRTSGALRFIWHFDRDQVLDDFHGERYWLDDLLERTLAEGTDR